MAATKPFWNARGYRHGHPPFRVFRVLSYFQTFVFAFPGTCFPVRAGRFSRFCADVLLPTVMGCITHSCGSYDSQLWVVQPITVGSKSCAHDWENICSRLGKHPLGNWKTSAHQSASKCRRTGENMPLKTGTRCHLVPFFLYFCAVFLERLSPLLIVHCPLFIVNC